MKLIIFKSLATISISIPIFTFSIVSCANSEGNQNITILFTNDTHCTITNSDNGLSWSRLAGFRNWLNSRGDDTILVDSGDFIQGGSYGSLSKGKYFTTLMNSCNYDVIIPGNHEFDYGLQHFDEIRNELSCPMISTNFYHINGSQIGERVLPASKTIEKKGKKIGFIGVTTPESLTKANPKTFQDESGNYKYTFLERNYDEYYSKIQETVDNLHNDGTDIVIALTHSGIDESQSDLYSANSLISHTSGITAVLDGHSHTLQSAIKVKNKINKDVYLTQTGSGFKSFGEMTIDKFNNLSFGLVGSTDYVDQNVKQVENDIENDAQQILNIKLGDLNNFDLVIGDNKNRWVRSRETNLADLIADSFAYLASNRSSDKANWPIAFTNGGNVRKAIRQGEVKFGNVLDASPFDNPLCKIQIKGSDLLDALEFSVYKTQKDHYDYDHEFGGFLQANDVLKFDVDTSIPSPVEVDASGNFVKISGQRRVSNVSFKNLPIDPTGDYDVVGVVYTFIDGGDGYGKIFKNAKVLPCPSLMDYEAISEYLKFLFDNNKIDEYSNPLGNGRINITK